MPRFIRSILLNTRRTSRSALNSLSKKFLDWRVSRDPPPDIHLLYFSNQKLNYYSYKPPAGFTPEEILRFPGAKRRLRTVKRVKEFIESGVDSHARA
ncbi:hypothetical protein BT96DRAFT_924223 [Gymnopus androsaceus JB14]|uniref:Uncharacterized protein n=1 Tax=Gymnopus androsaceus JB14 TaxID=1447944 RepID=A0A6A4H631_9AGAR|nr:hypothetical protein BT96DRAFT_924223 [Gymnopus androsaceus JB14]